MILGFKVDVRVLSVSLNSMYCHELQLIPMNFNEFSVNHWYDNWRCVLSDWFTNIVIYLPVLGSSFFSPEMQMGIKREGGPKRVCSCLNWEILKDPMGTIGNLLELFNQL